MNVLVGEDGFAPDDFAVAGTILPLEDLLAAKAAGSNLLGVDVPNTVKPEHLLPYFDRLALIRIAFPGMGDGRGFSIAQRLRQLGYKGRLRAFGPLIPDQLRAARRVGIDELEISDEQSRRQPEAQWRAVKLTPSYQNRVKSGAA